MTSIGQPRRRSERGQIATLEVIGILPLFMIVLGAIIQLFMIGSRGCRPRLRPGSPPAS